MGLLLSSRLVVGEITNEDCLTCHSDPSLTNSQGMPVWVDERGFKGSIHRDLNCTDCHTQPADYNEIPHFSRYREVNCANCHEEAFRSYEGSYHGQAFTAGKPRAPRCVICHSPDGNPHRLESLNLRTAEAACRNCHIRETRDYDRSLHSLAAEKGKPSPGCVGCHPTHSPALPPSVGAINLLCQNCHPGAMASLREGPHRLTDEKMGGTISCASCHSVHLTHKPHIDRTVIQACHTCHPGLRDQFVGSVHQELLEREEMNCLSCHKTHQVQDGLREDFGCGACHTKIEAEYRTSAHRLARLHGNRAAATCADCHDSHHILPPSHPQSLVFRENIPQTCARCHSDRPVVTQDYVRLPISLPSYLSSVHGKTDSKGRHPAVCTECHGVHSLLSASQPASTINRVHLVTTCGKCHPRVSEEYANSIHGKAVALGIKHSPSCIDCHEEHLILPVHDPTSPLIPSQLALRTCGKCHEDPAMAARYGLSPEAVRSYQDSYHSWAIRRGAKDVATCIDCHNVHEIRSRLDPLSSIHPDNVVNTCSRCHPGANVRFALSYTHILARERMMVHDWVRLIYIWIIVLVIGGMLIHNAIVFSYELRRHYHHHLTSPGVVRMRRAEVFQHLLLFITFTGLALTGFALRYPDAWWVKILTSLALTEETRRILHRVLAIGLVTASIWHLVYLALTPRGKLLFRAILPRPHDLRHAYENILFHLRLRAHPPRFGAFDYTQKAEYWALIWGTGIMTITGFILWFPTLATSWLPAWTVRVCEVIHFYEAILAVSAIVVWHLFYTVFHPREYPMSWTWLTGRMPKDQWDHHHPLARDEVGEELAPPRMKKNDKEEVGDEIEKVAEERGEKVPALFNDPPPGQPPDAREGGSQTETD